MTDGGGSSVAAVEGLDYTRPFGQRWHLSFRLTVRKQSGSRVLMLVPVCQGLCLGPEHARQAMTWRFHVFVGGQDLQRLGLGLGESLALAPSHYVSVSVSVSVSFANPLVTWQYFVPGKLLLCPRGAYGTWVDATEEDVTWHAVDKTLATPNSCRPPHHPCQADLQACHTPI